MLIEVIDDQFMIDCERGIREAIAEIQRTEGQIAAGDSGKDDEFSVSPRACCVILANR